MMNEAYALGLRHTIHTYNAMPPLHHRDPGLLGVALSDDRFTAEIIADGIHVHPALVKLLVRGKQVKGAVLITDSVAAAGLPDGSYYFEEQFVTVANGSARLEDGTLAGSTLTMDVGLANLVKFGAATLAEAIEIGSTNPARVIGVNDRKGQIAAGYDADLIALDDALKVQLTIVGGEVVYKR
jgi:N-acetylglucosamine-6-phosphate deacetylase